MCVLVHHLLFVMNYLSMDRIIFLDLPVDLLSPILSYLDDRRDWRSCCLVNQAFYSMAVPYLYRSLDSRVRIDFTFSAAGTLGYSCVILIKGPGNNFHLAGFSFCFVLHGFWVFTLSDYATTPLLYTSPPSTFSTVCSPCHWNRYDSTSSIGIRYSNLFPGAIHRLGMLVRNPNMTKEILAALALCTNLRSMTWIDDISYTTDSSLLRFLDVVRKLPLKELTIRTHSDPSSEAWSQLMSIVGLEKVSLCCTEVPSRVLHGWSEPLGNTLTNLELSVCISPRLQQACWPNCSSSC
jgi:hypothetical protein